MPFLIRWILIGGILVIGTGVAATTIRQVHHMLTTPSRGHWQVLSGDTDKDGVVEVQLVRTDNQNYLTIGDVKVSDSDFDEKLRTLIATAEDRAAELNAAHAHAPYRYLP